MGRATKRTLRQQRNRQAGAAPSLGSSRWIDAIGEPVDPEKFIFAAHAYQAAASMSMPTENLQSKPLLILDGTPVSLTDVPLNRGMMAVIKELREAGVENVQAYVWRLMHFTEILEARERFGALMKPSQDGTAMISDAVFYAAATAKMRGGPGHADAGFDIDEVIQVAQAYAIEHPDEDATEERPLRPGGA
jgi:hypothetical protein